MYRNDPLPLGRLMETMLGSRSESSLPKAETRWAATNQRHDTAMRKCQAVDTKIFQLVQELPKQVDEIQKLARELSLVAGLQQQLQELQQEAAQLRPRLDGLNQLYCELSAAASSDWTEDLTRKESEYRHSRLAHYQQLQNAMDAQLAEAVRSSAELRGDSAARMFQRDLENYRQGQMLRPKATVPVTETKPDSVALPLGDTREMDDFFSDVSPKVRSHAKKRISSLMCGTPGGPFGLILLYIGRCQSAAAAAAAALTATA
ncbi:hypothetical protein BX667DRAFT_159744 [Coemansia mojavensis]|nr:hypothetical protein BX667DRAFT_159744 [Coemansia mojavensis]